MRAHLQAAAVVTALGCLALAPAAIAQSAPSAGTAPAAGDASPQARAIAHYERGWAHYASGQYRAAANELEAAVRLDPQGYNLYFDLGLVYERLGMVDRAIGAYRRYFAHATDPAERERADRIVRRLQGARAELADLQVRMGRADALFWGVVAGAGASLTLGGALLFSAVRTDAQTQMLRSTGASPTLIDASAASASAQHVLADVALLGGVAFAAAGALLYFTREAGPRATPVCLPGTVGLRGAGLTLRF